MSEENRNEKGDVVEKKNYLKKKAQEKETKKSEKSACRKTDELIF